MLPEGKMSNEDKMNIDERRKYLRRMKKRYVQAGRKEQGILLDEEEVDAIADDPQGVAQFVAHPAGHLS
jgi:hypothetical protein